MPYAMVAESKGDSSVIQRRHFDIVAPANNEVQIRHTAIGLNFIDVYLRSGFYPWSVEKDHGIGREATGVIEAVGAEVDDFKIGDRVAYVSSHGAYCSHRNLHQKYTLKLPDAVSDETAAAVMLKGLTVYYLLHNSYAVKAGDWALFHAAAGGVGSIAGQWLTYKGVNTIGTAGGPEKCVLAKSLGFDHVIDYKSEEFTERVMQITDGVGVDVVYDGVGEDTYRGSMKVLKNFGMFVSFGQSSGAPQDFELLDLARNGSLSCTRPILDHFIESEEYYQKSAASLFELLENGHIKTAVKHRFPLNDAAQAHDALEARQTTGSVVLIP